MRRAIAPVFLATFLAVMACNLPVPASPTVEAPRPPADASVTSTAEIQEAGSGAEPTPSPSLESPSQVALETPSAPSLRVVFTDNGNLWLRDDLQPALPLTDFGSVAEVALSHDGSLIAYVLRDPLEGTAELRSVRADGTGDQALLTAANFDALYVLGERIHTTLSQWAFVPGTETLLFNTRGVFEGPGIAKNDDLLAIHARTGERTLLLNPGAGGDFTHSPDNSQLALVRPDSIGFASIDGSNPRAEVLEYPPVMTYSEYFFYPLPVWSSDGSAVLAAIPAEDPFATPSTGTLWWVPSDGSSPSAGPTLAGTCFAPKEACRSSRPISHMLRMFARRMSPACLNWWFPKRQVMKSWPMMSAVCSGWDGRQAKTASSTARMEARICGSGSWVGSLKCWQKA